MIASNNDRDMRCIELLPSGQYRCRVRRTKGGRKKQYVVSAAGSYEGAIAARDEIEADERVSGAGGVTVAEWGKIWLRRIKEAEAVRENRRAQLVDAVNSQKKKRSKDKEIRDIKNIESRLTCHILQSDLANMPMRVVKAKHVEEFVAWLGERDAQYEYAGSREVGLLSRRTRERILTVLRNLFKAALKDKERLCRCTVNPALGIQVPLEEDEQDDLDFVPEDVPLDKREQAILISSYGDDPEKYIILVAIGTGLRQGEQWNLELRDVHIREPDPNDPTKLESYIYVRWGSKGKAPKNGEARKIPLFGLGLEAMERWLEALPLYAPINPFGLVFPTRQLTTHKGTIWHRGGYRRGKSEVPTSFKKRQDDQILGEGRRFWWHALRHTCATGLLCAWWGRKWELLEISKMLGHKSLVVTQMYAKIVDKALLEVAAQAHAAYLQQQSAAATPPPAPVPSAPAPAAPAAPAPLPTTVLDGLMAAARAAVEQGNWTLFHSLGPMIDSVKGGPGASPLPPGPAVPAPPLVSQPPPAPAPVPTPVPQPVLRTMPGRAVRKGPAGRRSASRPTTLVGSSGDSEGPRESGSSHQLIDMAAVTGLHSGSFSPPPAGSIDGLIVAAVPVVRRRARVDQHTSPTSGKGVPEVYPSPEPTLSAGARSEALAGAAMVGPGVYPAREDAAGPSKPESGHEVAMGPPDLNDYHYLDPISVGLRNRRSKVRIFPGAPKVTGTYEDSAPGYGHHVATAPPEEERGPPEGSEHKSVGARAKSPHTGPEQTPEPAASAAPTNASSELAVLAQKVMRFAAAGRQDARRAAEDLASHVLLSRADGRHHEAARLVLQDADTNPDLTVPHGLQLAVQIIGGAPKKRGRKAKG